jgi:hypothetical protein
MFPQYKIITIACILLGMTILVLPEHLVVAVISDLATSIHSYVPSSLANKIWVEVVDDVREIIVEEIKEKVQ